MTRPRRSRPLRATGLAGGERGADRARGNNDGGAQAGNAASGGQTDAQGVALLSSASTPLGSRRRFEVSEGSAATSCRSVRRDSYLVSHVARALRAAPLPPCRRVQISTRVCANLRGRDSARRAGRFSAISLRREAVHFTGRRRPSLREKGTGALPAQAKEMTLLRHRHGTVRPPVRGRRLYARCVLHGRARRDT
jgi:hypothetical protein